MKHSNIRSSVFMTGHELGKVSENDAEKYLSDYGYRIIERNYRSRFGEIDIIAMDGDITVFIEVKARRNDRKGSSSSAVTPLKQRKVSMTALWYMKERKIYGQRARFDVVAIDGCGVNRNIRLIQNAFEIHEY